MQAAVESTAAKALNRIFVPILLSLIAFLGAVSFNDIRATLKEQALADQQQSTQIQQVRAEVQLLNAKVDYSVLQQMGALDRRVQLLEEQSRVLRQAK